MAAFDENIATLKQILPAPCLGVLPYDAELNIEQLANYLNLDALLAKPV
jgi:dethiobiotin synthetase